MKKFIIQAILENGYLLPAQQYGYTCIEAIKYNNWYHGEQVYTYELNDGAFECLNTGCLGDYLNKDCLPIGSVEYVLSWLCLMGVDKVTPLNIPKSLWKFCQRGINIKPLAALELVGDVFIKSTSAIKSDNNQRLYVGQPLVNDGEEYFITDWVDSVISEWRAFVYKGELVGLKHYQGDEWVLPDKGYIEKVIAEYDKICYTLDVMVYTQGKELVTEILELHDFFACGLYGFEDYRILAKMWITTIQELLKDGKS